MIDASFSYVVECHGVAETRSLPSRFQSFNMDWISNPSHGVMAPEEMFGIALRNATKRVDLVLRALRGETLLTEEEAIDRYSNDYDDRDEYP